jgi:HAD superfamily phosphoserine phosphatase-like hydrolase
MSKRKPPAPANAAPTPFPDHQEGRGPDQSVGGRPVAAFDLDGSLVREQLLVLLTKECFELQIFRKVAEVLFKEVRLIHRDRKITFEDYDRQVIALFTSRIKGKLRGDVEVAAKRVYEKHRDWLYVFTRALLEELKTTHECITITGAMIETVSLLAPYWGFEFHYGTELEVDELGRYTGRDVSVPVMDKRGALLAHVAKTGATLEGSVALGDTGSDIAMLSTVSRPVAFNPNDALADAAEKHGWPIVIERKDSIYVLSEGTSRRFFSGDARAAARYLLSLPKKA